MPRFLSPEWVEAFNDALVDVALPEEGAPGAQGSLVAAGGRYRIAQTVTDVPFPAPGSTVRIVLAVSGATVTLVLDPPAPAAAPGPAPAAGVASPAPAAPPAGPAPAPGADGPPGRADVEVVLSYPDAAALSRGELDPIGALGAGRVRVRGDLSVLVAGQQLLAAAASRLAGLHAVTTY